MEAPSLTDKQVY